MKRHHNKARLPAGLSMHRPLIAIVGRPNVGKSSLFNRLVGANLAIVQDQPGVTRDRHYGSSHIAGHEVIVVDTGGFDPQSEDPMQMGIAQQVRLALEEASVIVCLLDGITPPLPADYEAIQLLREQTKPVLYVANKIDSPKQALGFSDLYSLGIDKIYPVSALHGHGMSDLEVALGKIIPKRETEAFPKLEDVPYVSLLGKPNAGKSSLLNRLLGHEQQLVDSRPGTTVDAIDTLIEKRGQQYVFIDTAGLRKKSSKKDTIESASVFQAIRTLERSDVAVLLIDATLGVVEQDSKIASLIEDRGCALVIGLNKVDLLGREERKKAIRDIRDALAFLAWAPIVELSAKEGRGTNKLLDTARHAYLEHNKRVGTAELNRFFEKVLAHHPPPTTGSRAVRLYYVTQAQTRPPAFVAITNRPKDVHFSYQRYVKNQIRKHFGFEGTPIRVYYRPKKK
ncbi:MAG: ribosome biogenesis GTPase Der [Myxococcales bacterium]|nr:MAG: ribosome biogenesis GTPase Der [Myxococcales bacterium]